MSNSKNRNAEHNLIFAGLGLQLGIIAKDKVIRAFTEWLFDKTRPLGEILVHQKAITPEQRKTLESAVTAHIQQEGGEQKALASLNHVKDLESDLDHLADNDLNQTLDGAVTQRKLLGLDVLFSQSHDSESSSTNKKGSLSGPEGKQTDRFERQHFLDSGNLGEVFFAKDTELNRTVVTKYIRPEMSGDTFKQALFHLEGEVTGALEHPSVVPVYGLGKDIKGRIYYAMRYIRGKKLSRVIAEYHRKEAGLKQEALTGLLQNFQAVCLAIEYAHSKGVLHCDIKPDNIMIGDFGEVFVVDWGLVVVCGDVKGPSDMHDMETLDPGVIPPYKPSELASSGLHEQQGGSRRAVGGTPAYMAPEQFTATMSEDISLVTPKADIYALGSTLYHILTGKAPHLPKEGVKESPDAFYFRITTGMILTPREKDASISKLLEQIVLKAMQVEPSDRYASARELAEDIKRYVSDEPVHAYPESGLEKSRRWVRKNRTLVGATMVMLLLVAMSSMGLWLVTAIERDRANLQTKIAEKAKEEAEVERDRANLQTKIAESEKKKAEEEKDRAGKEATKALSQQNRAESFLFVSKINRAIRELESGSVKIGIEELVSTPFSYRGWEHNFITSNFYNNQVTFKSDSNGVFCYSLDGKKIAGGSRSGRIKIWDAETGKELQNLEDYTSFWSRLSFSPDGKKVACGNSDLNSKKTYSIKIWDAETGEELQDLKGNTGEITSVSFSPDEKKLLASSRERYGDDKNTDANHLKMWDLSNGKELVGFFKNQKGFVTTAIFSKDGKKIASNSEEGTDNNKIFDVKIWDAENGKELQVLKGHNEAITSVSFSPDGKKIASGSDDNSIKIWDAENGKELQVLKKHTEAITSVTFSPDGKKIASGSDDKSIKIWDAETGKELQILKGHTEAITSVNFSPDGKKIASGSDDKSIKIWDAETGEELQILKGHTDEITSVTFSRNGKTIISGGSDGIKIWGVGTGNHLQTLSGHTEKITSVSFSPDGTKIASGSDDFSIKIWDAETGKELQNLKGHTEKISSVTFSTDGKRLLSSSKKSFAFSTEPYHLKMWDVTTGKEPTISNNQNITGYHATFSPDGKKIARSRTLDSEIIIWDTESGKEVVTLLGSGDEDYNIISFSPDGKKVANFKHFERTIKIWDAETGKELQILRGNTENITSVIFSPDGTKIAGGSRSGGIMIWDAETGKELQILRGHASSVTEVSFSPDGKNLLSFSEDQVSNDSNQNVNHCKMWDLNTGMELVGLLNKQKGFVTTATFSPDGKKIVSGGKDGTITIWTADEKLDKALLQGEMFDIVGMDIKNNEIIAWNSEGILKHWDFKTGAELKEYNQAKEIKTGIKRVVLLDNCETLIVWDKIFNIWLIDTTAEKPKIVVDGNKKEPEIVCFLIKDKKAETINQKGNLTTFDLERNKEIKSRVLESWDRSNATFSPDGRKIASNLGIRIKIWDAETGKELQNLIGHTHEVISISFSLDSKKIASSSRDKSIKIWDTETGEELQNLLGHTEEITSISFSPDGKRLLSSSGDSGGNVQKDTNHLKLWDLTTGKELAILNNQKGSVYAATFSPDGKKIASGSWDNSIKIWNAETGKEFGTLMGHNNLVISLSFSPDGKKIASGCYDGIIKIWDEATSKEISRLIGLEKVSSRIFYFTEDSIISCDSFGRILIFDIATGDKVKTMSKNGPQINCLAFNKIAKFFARGFDDGNIKLIKASDLSEYNTIRIHDSSLIDICYSPDGKLIASGDEKGIIKIWEPESGDVLLSIQGDNNPTYSLAFSSNGKTVVQEYYNKNTLMKVTWETATGKKTAIPEDGHESVMSSNKKWSLESNYKNPYSFIYDKNIFLVNNELRAKRIASDKAKLANFGNDKLAKWGKIDPVWHLNQANEFEKSNQLNDEIFHLKLLVKINPDDKAIRLRLKKCEDSYSKFLEIQKTMDRAETAGFALYSPFSETKAKEAQKKAAMILNKEVEEKTDLGKGINLEMVLIPAGKFIMGSRISEKNHRKEETVHEVTLTKSYYMGKYEVTQEQWQEVVGNNPSKIKGAKLPVTEVSWLDCQEFIKKLNAKTNGSYRLPTEAEWEYACRAGTVTAYSYGDSITKDEANVAWGASTKVVGSYKPNAFGLYDMHGNVWEWCEDWKADYPKESVIDPKGPATGQYRLLRGGSFTGAGSHSRAANWWGTLPATKENDYLGLRLAKTP